MEVKYIKTKRHTVNLARSSQVGLLLFLNVFFLRGLRIDYLANTVGLAAVTVFVSLFSTIEVQIFTQTNQC